MQPERLSLPGAGVDLAADRWSPPDRSSGTALLLHGGGQTRHSWRHTGDRLAQSGWTAVAVDARGHGESQWSPDGHYDTDLMVHDLLAVTRDLGEAPVLIGASMGGVSSLLAEGEHGPVARALVLVDVVPTLRPEGVERIRRFMHAAPDGFASLDEVAASVAAYTPNRRRPVDPEGLRKNLRQGPDGRWRWHWDPAWGQHSRFQDVATLRTRLLTASTKVTVPTLVVRGTQSDLVTEQAMDELLSVMQDARPADVPDAGHMVVGDDNDVFAAQLQAFLDQLEPGHRSPELPPTI